jgi:hypothetical protein
VCNQAEAEFSLALVEHVLKVAKKVTLLAHAHNRGGGFTVASRDSVSRFTAYHLYLNAPLSAWREPPGANWHHHPVPGTGVGSSL